MQIPILGQVKDMKADTGILKAGLRRWARGMQESVLDYIVSAWIQPQDNRLFRREYRKNSLSRFWAKVELTPECWLWLGAKDRGGYGHLRRDEKLVRAHRYAYECLVGLIPDGLTLDHLCGNRTCVNPAHLEPVPLAENTRRGHRGRGHPHQQRVITLPQNG